MPSVRIEAIPSGHLVPREKGCPLEGIHDLSIGLLQERQNLNYPGEAVVASD